MNIKLLKEIRFLFFYNFLSVVICFILAFNKITSLIIFFSFSVLKITKQKLVIFFLSDFFTSSWYLSTIFSLVFSIIFFLYSVFLFFTSSWYLNQKLFFFNLMFRFMIIFSFFTQFSYFIHFFFLKIIFNWQFLEKFSIFGIFDINLQSFNLFYNLFFLSLVFFSLSLFLSFSLFCIKMFFSPVITFSLFLRERKKIYSLFLSFSFVVMGDFLLFLVISCYFLKLFYFFLVIQSPI